MTLHNSQRPVAAQICLQSTENFLVYDKVRVVNYEKQVQLVFQTKHVIFTIYSIASPRDTCNVSLYSMTQSPQKQNYHVPTCVIYS